MSANTVEVRGNLSAANTSRGPSPNIWNDCPVLDLLEDPGLGVYEFEDFIRGGLLTAPTTHAALVGLPYSGFSSSASQIAYGNPTWTNSTQDTGTIALSETTTRESTSLRSDVVPYRISANFGPLWFECRIKISTVAADEMAFFIGLFEDETLTVDIPIVAAGADTHLTSSKNMVGFYKPVANTTTYNATYRTDGNAVVHPNSGIGALAADTYVKLGFAFNQRKDNKLRFFVNNLEQTTTVTVPDNTGTTFPADVPMGWLMGMSVGTAASTNTFTCDWVRCAMLFAQ